MWGKQMLNQTMTKEVSILTKVGLETGLWCLHFGSQRRMASPDFQGLCRPNNLVGLLNKGWFPLEGEEENWKQFQAIPSLQLTLCKLPAISTEKFCSRIDDVVRLQTGTLPVIWRELEIAYDLMVSGVSFIINKYREYTPDNCCQILGVISQRAP